eukprot:TRINITY_DN3970_c0_g1_i1.p1 TRINITY_DN3970_c0_g1~~TRINITY_DN3970_c0_g1_i1.p1  ORF type:complete len:105 (-),score=24.04 TRINITY_DN3970_c0_g1_i1:105-419(-)
MVQQLKVGTHARDNEIQKYKNSMSLIANDHLEWKKHAKILEDKKKQIDELEQKIRLIQSDLSTFPSTSRMIVVMSLLQNNEHNIEKRKKKKKKKKKKTQAKNTN